ncbi:hypothetical protein BFW01_g801 [Lasiodiplodia theobromae]|uniref:RNase H type-1 domain-containing protein n=1 Tax=Lasiodiplodia theobromae TaxID=45133 RepID=A0A5N5DL81_9PEZI|nr:Ribonuclease h [Lasiodiplodia theobromae]KAB2578091.1 hypothetical protein DBV05_g3150 [Lasiodiplodia theobromae]KAF4534146.1 Ribonuclease h [Lasiodiplodia theobromae]KAF9641441.1 hypothetical protein BFW01_g801 [Lasiodiplodia theobromae]
MVHHAHKTCTDWSSTRLYDPYPTLALKSYPTLSTASPSISVCSSAASSTTLTPTPSTTPPQPKSFLLTDDDHIGGGGILSESPPSFSSTSSSPPSSQAPPPSSGAGAASSSSICTLTDLETLHAGHAFTHLPCPHERCPDPACAAPALHTDAILVSVHGSYFRSAKTGAPMAAAAVWFAEGSPLNKVVRLDEEYPGGDLGGGGEPGGNGDGGDGNGKGGGGGGHVNGGSSFGEVTRQRVELLAGIRALERVADVVRALEEEARRRRRQQRKRGGGGGAAMGMPGTRDWYVAGVEKKKQQKHGNGMGLRYGEDEEDRDDEEEREMEDDEDGALSQLVLKTHSKYLVRAAVEGLAKWKANGWMNSRGKVVANVDLLWYLDRRITWLEWVGVEVMFLLVGKEDNEGAIKLIGKGLD